MRRILVGATLASIAVAVVMLIARPTQQPERPAFRLQVGQTHVTITVRNDSRPLSQEELRRLQVNLQRLQAQRDEEIDPDISIMDCRIVAQERLSGDHFLLTEECRWKGGGVERRRFLAFRKDDGPSQGWMYRLAESDI